MHHKADGSEAMNYEPIDGIFEELQPAPQGPRAQGAPHTSSTSSSTWLFPAHFTLRSMVAITITNPSVTLLKAKSATLWHVDDESRYE